MSILSKIFGDKNSREIKAIEPILEKVNSFEHEISLLSDDDLKLKTSYFKDKLKNGATLDDILPEAFAVVREASKRTLGQRHYDVQIIGGIVMHQGKIAEMRTGEGKTLVATLPAYLNALSGRGVHVVTVNDYLSRRDAVWMGQIYNFLGMSVGVINNQECFLYDPSHKELDKERDQVGLFKIKYEFLKPCTKKEAYAADITYGTNNEFGFDYLRDNLAYDKKDLVQRFFEADGGYKANHNFAIVDEVDSVLIDEARTPLIISAPVSESESLYGTFAKIAELLHPDTDYVIDEKMKAVSLTDAGIEKAEKSLGIENIYTDKGIKYVHHLETAVRAKALFHIDKHYVIKNGEVIIVDESTGRMQPGRRWSEGLHQAIEAKEGVKVQQESRTMATVSFQNYFRMYSKLAGMTGTASTSSEEFQKVYNLDVVTIPTNKEIKRDDKNDLVFQTEDGKLKALSRKVKELNQKGQPVLIGTISIEKNEMLSFYLQREGVPHNILNAKNHEREGEIIANAGKKGAVVVATNMAGRGVDIKLGGPMATEEEKEEIKSLGGLFVLGTERHEARRIDNQLRGRSGRQGDPGETQFYVSLEDDLMRIFASDFVKSMMGKFGIPEDEPIESRIISKTIESAQTKIEGLNFDARKHLLEYDDVMNHQRNTIYEKRRKILLGDRDFFDLWIGDIAGKTDNKDKLLEVIREKRERLGYDRYYQLAGQLVLQIMDMLWVEHLEAMDFMRGSVRLRAYGQRDPLVEYKKEGLLLFKNLEVSIGIHITNLLPQVGQDIKQNESSGMKEVHESARIIGDKADGVNTSSSVVGGESKEIGRNDPCFCGSGKKFKKCHGVSH